MDQVVRSLRRVSVTGSTDARRAAAHAQLAICYASYISCPSLEHFSSERAHSESFQELISAATLGNLWARATLHRISQALDQPISGPLSATMEDWLFDEASNGSWIALESLSELDARRAREACQKYLLRSMLGQRSQEEIQTLTMIRTNTADDSHDEMLNLATPVNKNKDTLLHWLATIGDTATLERAFLLGPGPTPGLGDPQARIAVVNQKNDRGDTPLLCAARRGHAEVVVLLLEQGADATMANTLNEAPLHFLHKFDKGAIPSMARLLLEAGGDAALQATGFSDHPHIYTETGLITMSCPRLRAVFANSPVALESLLDRKGKDPKSLSKTPTHQPVADSKAKRPRIAAPTRATQKALMAWALRLHHFEVIKVLKESLSCSSLFTQTEKIEFWVGSTPCSAVELCIMGCQASGTSSSSGLNMPEPYIRMLSHGKDHQRALHMSLEFLISHAEQLFVAPCGGARNPLFYAIKHGHHDVVAFLTSTHCEAIWERLDLNEFGLFSGSYDPWVRCRETLNLLGGIPPWGQDNLTWDEYKHRPADPMSRKTKRQIRVAREQALIDQRHGMGRPIWFAGPSQTFRGFVGVDESSPGNSSDDGDSTDDDKVPDSNSDEEEGRDDRCPHSSAMRSIRAVHEPEPDNPYIGTGVFRFQPTNTTSRSTSVPSHEEFLAIKQFHSHHGVPNYRDMEGVIDAVTLSILCGKRKVFHDLILGPAVTTIKPIERRPSMVSTKTSPPSPLNYHITRNGDHNIQAHIHRTQKNNECSRARVSYRFPVQGSRFSVTLTKKRESTPFDGVLRYHLLYMTLIARSVHRDIGFA